MWTRIILFMLLIVGLTLGACSKSRKAAARNGSSHKTERNTVDIKTKYAQSLGVRPEDLRNHRLYVFIDAWEGTPYRYGGTSQSGVDCSGFVGAVYRDVYRKTIPRTTGELEKAAKGVSKKQLKEGDLVFFDIDGKKNAHVGVYLINNKFVHASSSKGVIVSDLNNPYYQKAFARGGKL